MNSKTKINGRVLSKEEKSERDTLIATIEANCETKDFAKGFEIVMEEVAYTWFNRFIALRFMEVNGYLPSHTRVFSDEGLKVVGSEKHTAWADEVASSAITLVRDEQKLLPISPRKYKRIYLNVIQKTNDPTDPYVLKWKNALEKEGFEVTVRDRRTTIVPEDFDNKNLSDEKKALMNELYRGVEVAKKDYDLYLYVANMQNASNNTTLRLNWNVVFGLGDDAPWMTKEIPVMMVSTANPYHLFDAPMIKTYINSYSGEDRFINATIDKIMGRSEFKGVSPVDPFCGKDYI